MLEFEKRVDIDIIKIGHDYYGYIVKVGEKYTVTISAVDSEAPDTLAWRTFYTQHASLADAKMWVIEKWDGIADGMGGFEIRPLKGMQRMVDPFVPIHAN